MEKNPENAKTPAQRKKEYREARNKPDANKKNKKDQPYRNKWFGADDV